MTTRPLRRLHFGATGSMFPSEPRSAEVIRAARVNRMQRRYGEPSGFSGLLTRTEP
jgi:hypothetical protein